MPILIRNGQRVRIILADDGCEDREPSPIIAGATVTVAAITTSGDDVGTISQSSRNPCSATFTGGVQGSRGYVEWTISEPGEPVETIQTENIRITAGVKKRGRRRIIVCNDTD